MIKVYLFILALFTMLACEVRNRDQSEQPGNESIKYVVHGFPANNGWGYSIFIDKKEFIRQTIIPVIEGNQSFSTKEEAEKTGRFVLEKIKEGQSPSLTISDLEKLGLVGASKK